MKLSVFIALLAGACVIWNVVTSLRIYDDLRRRKIPVNFLWLRVQAPEYAFQYKKITTLERGKPGPLFNQWIVSINLALVLGIAAIIAELS